MAKLRLIDLKCNETEDSTGADEAYLRVRGREIWKSSMNDGDSEDLTHLDPDDHRFTSTIKLELLDEDSGIFDSDDHLGSVTIKATDAGKGERTHTFRGDGANYTLTYEVVHDSGGSTGRAPARPTHQLEFKSLRCFVTEDSAGADEAYLRASRRHVWGPKSINNGEIKYINLAVPFTGNTLVELKEADTGFLDADDYIGSIVVSSHASGHGEQREVISGDGAIYELRYEVTPFQG